MKKYEFPPEYKNSKKNISEAFKKLSMINKNVDFSFEDISDLQNLEDIIFGRALENQHTHFALRFHQQKKKQQKKK